MDEQNLAPIEHDNNPLSKAIIAQPDGTVTYTNCHVCQSKHRLKIEEIYDRNPNIPAIKAYLQEAGEIYSLSRLRYHFDNHYKNMTMHAAMIDYRDNLVAHMKRSKNMVEDADTATSIGWIELSKVLAIEAADLDKMEKKQRIVSGYIKTIMDAQEFIKSLHDSETKARATEERFVKIWLLKLQEAETEEERKLLTSMLEDFKTKILQSGE